MNVTTVPQMVCSRWIQVVSMALLLSVVGCGGEEPPGGGNGNPDGNVTTSDGGPGDRDGGGSGTTDGSTNDSDGSTSTSDGAVGGRDASVPPDSGWDAGTDPRDPNNPNQDSDCDGLSDAEEFSIVYPGGGQTGPGSPDSDEDGILDGVEAGRTMSLDPRCAAFVGDADPSTTTSPVSNDTDGDGILDGAEDANRNGAVDPSESNPRAQDSDGDRIPDNVEDVNLDGVRDPGELDPSRRDTDEDGIADGVEDANQNGTVDAGETDPLNTDTDGDGLDDGVEDSNQNGMTEPFETDPRTIDTDCDGISDADELNTTMTSPLVPDTDGDGIADGIELGLTMALPGTTCPGFVPDADPTTTTDPTDADSDDDGVEDGVEDSNQNGAVDPPELDPGDADSDGDGVTDGDEISSGFDPTNPNDPPMGQSMGINAICSDYNLKVVDFDLEGTTWTLANEQSTAYAPVTVSAAGSGVELAALDDTNGMAGFVLRMPLLGGATAEADQQRAALDARIQAGVGAQSLTYTLRFSGRAITSHDGFSTVVSNVYDISANPNQSPAGVRNALVRLISGLAATDFTGLPTTTGQPTPELVFSYQILVRDAPQELIVLGAVLPRTQYDNPADNSSVFISDLTNGTSLAQANAPRGKDCDPFIATGVAVADFIWMADISGSTDDDRNRIVAAAGAIVNALGQNGVDFRMGVVPHTENDIVQGAGNGGDLRGMGFVRDPAVFATYLRDTNGTDGCEFGLDAARSAVAKALPRTAQENARRLRQDATLAVVYISDEFAQELTGANVQNCNNYNPPPGCNTGVVDYYQGDVDAVCELSSLNQTCVDQVVQPYIDQIVNENGVAFAQVVVPNANPTVCTGYACPGGQPANEPGLGYLEAVNGTGGTFYSPCNNNPGPALQAIVDAVTGAASEFTLNGTPISSTIRVGVIQTGNGNMLVNVPRDKDDGFDYDPVSNAIFFRGSGFRPAVGDIVVASYRNWQDPNDPCGPCQAGAECDPQLGVCTCSQAACAVCGANEICDANCACACAPDCNGNCGPGETCNAATCQCECASDCGGACGPGTVCNPQTCQCECGPDCGGACPSTSTTTPSLVCDQAACNCQCPADCGGACTGDLVCNSSTCDCECALDCEDNCVGNAVCNPANGCACECPADCGGCPDNSMCNPNSCACECAPNCDAGCPNLQICDPNEACGCICPNDCGGCEANEMCDPVNCRCIPIV